MSRAPRLTLSAGLTLLAALSIPSAHVFAQPPSGASGLAAAIARGDLEQVLNLNGTAADALAAFVNVRDRKLPAPIRPETVRFARYPKGIELLVEGQDGRLMTIGDPALMRYRPPHFVQDAPASAIVLMCRAAACDFDAVQTSPVGPFLTLPGGGGLTQVKVSELAPIASGSGRLLRPPQQGVYAGPAQTAIQGTPDGYQPGMDHSIFQAHFDGDAPILLEGRFTGVDWTKPYVTLRFTDAAGKPYRGHAGAFAVVTPEARAFLQSHIGAAVTVRGYRAWDRSCLRGCFFQVRDATFDGVRLWEGVRLLTPIPDQP